MGILSGKTAVITGSTRGLGYAAARDYLQEGANVVVCSRSPEAVKQAVASLSGLGGKVSGIACNVSDFTQVQELARHTIQAFGGFDIWVNNAGTAGPYGSTAWIDPEKFTSVLGTNIFGTYYGSLVALRYFLSKKSGKLINILGQGEQGPAPNQIAYGSSKAWERAFTLALAKENQGSGVGIFAFNPGLMETEFLTQVSAVEGYTERLKIFPTIIRLLGNPPEVPARKMVWLASSATDGKTGLLVRMSRVEMMGKALGRSIQRLVGRGQANPELEIHEVPKDTRDLIGETNMDFSE